MDFQDLIFSVRLKLQYNHIWWHRYTNDRRHCKINEITLDDKNTIIPADTTQITLGDQNKYENNELETLITFWPV